jgi:glucosamine--fructose-6-phosphate aminotransferase (isomerizing)
MSGIIGIAGNGEIAPLLVESLRRLDYGDYDSCGLATLNELGIEVRKDVGAVEDVARRWNFTAAQGQVGIAHTRLASDGDVSYENAHPQLSCDQNFALVHNGIICNHRALKRVLEGLRTHFFYSATDTEVIAHLIEEVYRTGVSVEDAFAQVMRCLKGSFAVAMISPDEPGKIFCAAQKSPLMLGIHSGANFVASDVNALWPHTRHIVSLNDGDYAVIFSNGYRIRDMATGEERHNQQLKSTARTEQSAN